MAIEGPLRELGLHDVFQLLDLSRKTGVLTAPSGSTAGRSSMPRSAATRTAWATS
jgi:hypothetical protein